MRAFFKTPGNKTKVTDEAVHVKRIIFGAEHDLGTIKLYNGENDQAFEITDPQDDEMLVDDLFENGLWVDVDTLTDTTVVYELRDAPVPDPDPDPTPDPDPDPTPDPNPSTLDIGIAIAGMEFAETVIPGVANQNYNTNSAARYAMLASKGFKVVRLPFLSGRLFDGLGGGINATYAGFIDQNIQWAAANGMKVWLDCHDYARFRGTVLGSGGFTVAEYVRQKVAILERFKSHSNVVGFEFDNEPHDVTGGLSAWYTAATQATNALLAVAGWSGTIGLPVYHWSSNDDFFVHHGQNFVAPVKNARVIYIFHNYFNAGNTGFNHPAAPNESAQVHVDRAQAVLNWASSQDVKTGWSEFGIPDEQDWIDNAKPFVDLLKANVNNIPYAVYWADGDWYASDTDYKDIHAQLVP